MNSLTLFKGRKGKDGADGTDGLGPSEINTFDLDDPISSLINPNNKSNSAVLENSRDSYSSYVDRYGNNKYTTNSETTNFVKWSNNFFNWNDVASRWTYSGTTAGPIIDSLGSLITLDVDTDSLPGAGEVAEITVESVPSGQMNCVSFYYKVVSGDVPAFDFVIGSRKYSVENPSQDWIRVTYPVWQSGTFIFSINPRGKSGAVVALYGAQIENSNTSTDLISTTGTEITRINSGGNTKQSDRGYLTEEGKTNLLRNSNDLSLWTIENGTVSNYENEDPFGHKSQNVRVSWATVPELTIEGLTDPLVAANEYTVSFYSYIAGGSLNSLSVSLGEGIEVSLPAPSVTGFQRVSVKCIAGNSDSIKIKAVSEALNAILLISCIQIETGDLTSYIDTGLQTSTRSGDVLSLDYAYNIPKPSNNWSFVCKLSDVIDSPIKKTIFSNGQSGSNEFSFYVIDRLFTINNGSNTASFDLFDFEKMALVYDGVSIKFYGETTLLSTQTLGSTSFISSKMYIGSNGSSDFINANISFFNFFTSALTDNEVLYLMGK